MALLILLLAGCSDSGGNGTAAPTGAAPAATASENIVQPPATLPPAMAATNTPVPATPTPTAPLAAVVNGEQIFLADYEAELARFQAQTGGAAEGGAQQVLDAMIERVLIRQAAAAEGVTVTPEMIDQRLAELRAAGDEAAFQTFLEANNWTEEEFRQTLESEIYTAEMIARVTADVPTTAEYVRASYIQMEDGALAQSVLERAVAGDDFAFLAEQNSIDRLTGANGGDLGFFKEGSLLVPEVETAAFALQPGEISDLISVTGDDGRTVYYIVQVTEREPNRELTADDRYSLLQAAFDKWLQGLWDGATIERLVE